MPTIKTIYTATQLTTTINTTSNGAAVSLDGAKIFSVQCNVVDNTPAAKLFASTAVDTSLDTATITTHGYLTGIKGQLTTTGGLPAGLSLATDYFIIKVDANTVKFATSLANALAGTAVDMTTQGSGNDTFTPTALAGANVKLQKSNDGTNWSDEGTATNITVAAVIFLEKADPCALYMRVSFTLTAGQLSSSNVVLVKGPN